LHKGDMAEEEKEVLTSQIVKAHDDFSSLYLNQRYSDITINVHGRKFYAHKAILAARCDFFKFVFYDHVQAIKESPEAIGTDISVWAFQELLRFIYTGAIITTPNVTLILELLEISVNCSFTDLENFLTNKLKSALNLENAYDILNVANSRDLDELRDACHTFMDENAPEIIASLLFNNLPQKSAIGVLQRDTFCAPEIAIFDCVAKWCKVNKDVDNLVIQCVRLSLLTVDEIVSTVRPSKLVEDETLWAAVAEIIGIKPKTSFYRIKKSAVLLTSKTNVNTYAYHPIDNSSSITVRLGAPSQVNYIKMRLLDEDLRFYSYYIEVSLDQRNWKRIINYSYPCRSWQDLYFKEEMIQYIRIVGTYNSASQDFHLVSFEAYYKSDIPKLVGDIICPDKNFAILNKKALVIEGNNPNVLLQQHFEIPGFTYHTIDVDQIVVHFAQPYMISRIQLLLWEGGLFRYFIETSVDKTNWRIAVDRTKANCSSWQLLQFDERPVVFIKIVGTYSTVTNDKVKEFRCALLKCFGNNDDN
jgi:BTB/POZ domain-containing protein 9